jgi:hypothetical protein
MTRLLSYLIAGARLAGCKSSPTCVDPPHTFDLTTPTGDRYVWRNDRDNVHLYDVVAGVGYRATLQDITRDDLLERWQPDRESSVSRQHFVDTGLYLPMGAAERQALGVEDDADEIIVGDVVRVIRTGSAPAESLGYVGPVVKIEDGDIGLDSAPGGVWWYAEGDLELVDEIPDPRDVALDRVAGILTSRDWRSRSQRVLDISSVLRSTGRPL